MGIVIKLGLLIGVGEFVINLVLCVMMDEVVVEVVVDFV